MDNVIFKSSMLMCQTVQKVQIMWSYARAVLGVEPLPPAAQVVVVRSLEDIHSKLVRKIYETLIK